MYGLTDDEWRDLRASLKTSMRDRPLSPGKVAALLNRAMERCSPSELAVALEFKDQSTLRKIANLDQLETDLLAQVAWGARKGRVSMSVAAELQRLDSAATIRTAFERARRDGLSRSDARRLVKTEKS